MERFMGSWIRNDLRIDLCHDLNHLEEIPEQQRKEVTHATILISPNFKKPLFGEEWGDFGDDFETIGNLLPRLEFLVLRNKERCDSAHPSPVDFGPVTKLLAQRKDSLREIHTLDIIWTIDKTASLQLADQTTKLRKIGVQWRRRTKKIQDSLASQLFYAFRTNDNLQDVLIRSIESWKGSVLTDGGSCYHFRRIKRQGQALVNLALADVDPQTSLIKELFLSSLPLYKLQLKRVFTNMRRIVEAINQHSNTLTELQMEDMRLEKAYSGTPQPLRVGYVATILQKLGKASSALKTVKLDMKVGPDGKEVAQLAKVIKQAQSIKSLSLDIRALYIYSHGDGPWASPTTILEAFADTGSMQSLHLSLRNFLRSIDTADEVEGLTDAIQKIKSLKKLDLSIRNVGVSPMPILKAFAANGPVESLNLTANFVPYSTSTAGTQALKNFELALESKNMILKDVSFATERYAGHEIPLSDRAKLLLKVNAAGRGRLLESPEDRTLWISTILKHRSDPSITFYLLRQNPVLCYLEDQGGRSKAMKVAGAKKRKLSQ